jgi:hypothetical protein
MVELKGYTEADIEKLKTELTPEQNLATAWDAKNYKKDQLL